MITDEHSNHACVCVCVAVISSLETFIIVSSTLALSQTLSHKILLLNKPADKNVSRYQLFTDCCVVLKSVTTINLSLSDSVPY